MPYITEGQRRYVAYVNILAVALAVADMFALTEIIQVPADILLAVNLVGCVIVGAGFVIKRRMRRASAEARRAEAGTEPAKSEG